MAAGMFPLARTAPTAAGAAAFTGSRCTLGLQCEPIMAVAGQKGGHYTLFLPKEVCRVQGMAATLLVLSGPLRFGQGFFIGFRHQRKAKKPVVSGFSDSQF